MPEQQKVLALPTEIDEGQAPVLTTPNDPAQVDDPTKEPAEMDEPGQGITESEGDQDILDDLGEIEFLLDEIEDQIAPLAL